MKEIKPLGEERSLDSVLLAVLIWYLGRCIPLLVSFYLPSSLAWGAYGL